MLLLGMPPDTIIPLLAPIPERKFQGDQVLFMALSLVRMRQRITEIDNVLEEFVRSDWSDIFMNLVTP